MAAESNFRFLTAYRNTPGHSDTLPPGHSDALPPGHSDALTLVILMRSHLVILMRSPLSFRCAHHLSFRYAVRNLKSLSTAIVPFQRQVLPLRIKTLDQCHLLASTPAFDLLLPLDCRPDVRGLFIVSRPGDVVFGSESRREFAFVLVHPAHKAVGHANVEAADAIREDIRRRRPGSPWWTWILDSSLRSELYVLANSLTNRYSLVPPAISFPP